VKYPKAKHNIPQRRKLFDEALRDYGVISSVGQGATDTMKREPFADFADDEGVQKDLARKTSHAGILLGIKEMVNKSEHLEVAKHIKQLEAWLASYSCRLPRVRAAPVERGEGAPQIAWRYATTNYSRDPDLVPPVEDYKPWSGTLFIGTLDHAIDSQTLSHYNVAAIFSTLNLYHGTELGHDTKIAMQHRKSGIEYLDWCPNHRGKSPEQAFNRLQALLSHGKTVLVHCRNGRDRSVFAVWAFLCLYYRYTEDSCYSPT